MLVHPTPPCGREKYEKDVCQNKGKPGKSLLPVLPISIIPVTHDALLTCL